jgi:hypothetical protein
MNLFDHPIWPHVLPYAHVTFFGKVVRLDFLQLPDQLRELALAVVANCPSCGAVIHPMRARALSERSRIAGTAVERRLFYAPTCPTEKDPGCSRTKAAMQHKDEVRAMLGRQKKHEAERFDNNK